MKRKSSFSKRCLETMLTAIVFLLVSTGSWAQDIAALSPSLLKSNPVPESDLKTTSLQEFMNEFKKVYQNVYYSYESNTLKSVKVNYDALDVANQGNPDVALNKVLSTAGLTFEKVKEVYVIKKSTQKKEEQHFATPAAMITSTADATDFAVSGRVSDENGGIAGATVTEKGTSNATTTDNNGNFSLTVANSSATLVISSIGYAMQEVSINGRSQISITLASSVKELEGVVVTALGIKRSEKALGYSVAQLDGSEVSDVKSANMINALAGKVAGVNIRAASPDPGATVFMTIRGQRSLYGDNQPLIVLDGVPVNNSVRSAGKSISGPNTSDNNQIVDYGNPISDINPDDIASISVLRGAAASALYGSRAANGVVLITTKTGADNNKRLGVSVNSSAMFDKAWQFPKFQNIFGSGDREGTDDVISDASWGPRLDNGTKRVQWDSPLDENGDPIPTDWISYPNRVKDFYETGSTLINNVAVGGNTEKGNFRLSYTNLTNKGIVPNTDLKRNNITLAAGYTLHPKIKVNTNIAYTQNGSKNRPSFNRGSVNNIVYTMPANINVQKLKNYWLPDQENIKQNSPVPGGNDNPYFIAYESINGFDRNRLTGNVQVNIDITPELSVMGRTGLDFNTEDRESRKAFSSNSYPNGAYALSKSSFTERNTDFLITYKKNISSDWFVSLSGGGNRMDQNGRSASLSTNNLVMPGVYSIGNAAAGTVQDRSGGSKSQKRINSLYAMGQVSFKNYAFLDLTARNDWSSTLPPENNSYFYPSASLSLVLSDMLPGIQSKALSFAKLRGNLSQAGSDIGAYGLYNTISLSGWDGINMANLSTNLANNQLKPEISTSMEIGADLRFLSNRIGLDFTWYRTKIENQVFNIPTTAASGYGGRAINAGEIQNQGMEITLSGTPINNAFKWNIAAVYSRNRNKVVRLTDGVTRISLGGSEGVDFYIEEGAQMGDFYARTWERVPDGPHKGEPLLDDAGEYQRVNEYAKIGNYNPDFMIGFTNTFSYKGFTLSALLDWRQGGQFYSYVAKNLLSDGRTEVTVPGRDKATGGLSWNDGTHDRNDGQTLYGYVDDGNGNYVLNTVITDPENYYGSYYWDFAERSTFSASYVKLREVSLDYTFGKSVLKNLPISNITVGFIARNLFSWTAADQGYDPETSMVITNGVFTQGVGGWSLPYTRSYGFKIGINF